jgi:hypothetical protein
MSSGRGIMHEEMLRRSLDGNVYGFQLWDNLPASRKMGPLCYQEVSADSFPLVKRRQRCASWPGKQQACPVR